VKLQDIFFSELVKPAGDELRSNLHHLYWDILWFGVVAGSTMAFIAIYATRLGGTPLQIGILSAGPAVVNLIFTIPAGRWMENRIMLRVVTRSSIFHRAGYLVMIFLPMILASQIEVRSFIFTTIIMSIPGTFLAISFNALFADVVPPEWRGYAVGRRNALIAVSITLTTLLCGLILDRMIFPLNYQIVFGIGALGAFLSTYHLGRIQLSSIDHKRVNTLIGDLAQPGGIRWQETFRQLVGLRFVTRLSGSRILRLDLIKGRFGLFMLSFLIFYTVHYIAIPIFPAFYVNNLALTDGEISLGTALFYIFMMFGSLRLSNFSSRYGHRNVMLIGAMLFCVYPLMLSIAQGAKMFLIASLLGGLISALISGGLINRLMERIPADDRPAHMALHNIALNLGILCGALLGPALANWVDLREALLIAGLLRVGAAGLMVLWG
jgi:MFS family permease